MIAVVPASEVSLPLAFAAATLLGMRHATDADHVAAVSTIICRERSALRSGWIGAMWGLGHMLTLFAVGAAIILLKWSITPRVGLSLEFSVALMLVVLGVLNLAPHPPHAAPGAAAARLKPFLVGVVHGLAGSAGATLLVVPLIRDARWAFAYLTVFGLGTIAGMLLVTASIAVPASYATLRVPSLQRAVRLASGAISVAFGLYLGYKIGFVDGLLTVGWPGAPP
ncbi:MAG: high-affinity nickel-transport family protein [Gemmatimonadota bacterium]|nr:high-affinity nickel-transport family protein [Gemmatimonadota bacterium]